MMMSLKETCGAVLLCGTLALGLASGPVHAAENPLRPVVTSVTYASAAKPLTGFTALGDFVFSKRIDASTLYEAAHGLKLYSFAESDLKEGEATMASFSLFSGDVKSSIQVKTEDGVTLYSTDDGATWSEEVPEGFESFTAGIEGDSFFTATSISGGELHDIQTKTEDGVTLYSTDYGATWSEELPEGIDVLGIMSKVAFSDIR